MSLWWSAAGARGLAGGRWSRVLDVLLLVAFASPRMGSGSLLHCAAVGARCPRNDTGVLGIGGTEPSRAGEPETFFSSCMPGVNLSPDSNNIFSQPQKRHKPRGPNEPARVDAPGRANSKAERRAAPARLEKRLSEGKLWPALWFRAIGASRDLARQANSTLI